MSQHIKTIQTTTTTTNNNNNNIPISSNNIYCIYFMRGKCNKGQQCSFLHHNPNQNNNNNNNNNQSSLELNIHENKRKAEDILNKHSFKKNCQHLIQSKKKKQQEVVRNENELEIPLVESDNSSSVLRNEVNV